MQGKDLIPQSCEIAIEQTKLPEEDHLQFLQYHLYFI